MCFDFNNKTPQQVAEHYGLKPCPFCGGAASFKRKYQRAYCSGCDVSISPNWSHEYDHNDAIRWAINKWNTRVSQNDSDSPAKP